jgi:hypothetical protein
LDRLEAEFLDGRTIDERVSECLSEMGIGGLDELTAKKVDDLKAAVAARKSVLRVLVEELKEMVTVIADQMGADCDDVLERMTTEIAAEKRPDERLGGLLTTAGNRFLQYDLGVEDEGCDSTDSECP